VPERLAAGLVSLTDDHTSIRLQRHQLAGQRSDDSKLWGWSNPRQYIRQKMPWSWWGARTRTAAVGRHHNPRRHPGHRLNGLRHPLRPQLSPCAYFQNCRCGRCFCPVVRNGVLTRPATMLRRGLSATPPGAPPGAVSLAPPHPKRVERSFSRHFIQNRLSTHATDGNVTVVSARCTRGGVSGTSTRPPLLSDGDRHTPCEALPPSQPGPRHPCLHRRPLTLRRSSATPPKLPRTEIIGNFRWRLV